jgi:hypothetical protein
MANLSEIGDKAVILSSAAIPDEIRAEISTAYESLSKTTQIILG